MVAGALKCPFCESGDVRPYGTSNGKKRYACKIQNVLIRRFTWSTAITDVNLR
jgi:transposase-like protein